MVKLLCGNIYFAELRIKEQLGYVTKGKVFGNNGQIYYLIIVQGSKKTPDQMDVRIENVVKLMRDRLEKVTEKKFKKFLKVLGKRISTDKSFVSRSNRLWKEIITGRKYYNIGKLVKRASSRMKKSHMLKFFDRVFYSKLSKLSIQEYSSKVKKFTKKVGKIRGVKGKLIKSRDYFRIKNKFI